MMQINNRFENKSSPVFLFSFRMSLSFQMVWSPAIYTAFLGCSNLHTVSLWVSRNVSSPWPLRLGCRSAPLQEASHVLCQESLSLHAGIGISSVPSSRPPDTGRHSQEKQRQPFSLLFCHTLLNEKKERKKEKKRKTKTNKTKTKIKPPKHQNHHKIGTKPWTKSSVLSSVMKAKSSRNLRHSVLQRLSQFSGSCAPCSFPYLRWDLGWDPDSSTLLRP